MSYNIPRVPHAPKSGLLTSLRPGQKIGVLVGGFALMLLVGCAARPGDDGTPQAAAVGSASPAAASAEPSPSAEPLPSPVVAKRTVTETRSIPHAVKRVNDSTLAKGKTRVKTQGVNGVKKITWEVTTTDGVQTAKVLVREEVTKQPVTEVIQVGTKTSSSSCNPNYSGCVPNASDVDCAGGSGNGPAYVRGPINVIGTDVYGLDADHDGIACE